MKRHLLTLTGVLMASQPLQAELLLNEVHLNPPNKDGLGDRNYEYIEIRSTLPAPNASESTNGVTLLIVNNDRWDFKENAQGVEVPTNLNMGEVWEAWSLEDLKTGTNGLLLLGDKYTELPKGGPWAGFIDPATEVGDPPGLGDNNIKSNDGLSIFLVRGYTNPAPNNNGVVDFDVDENGLLDWEQPGGPPSPPPGVTVFAVPQFTQVLDKIGTRDINDPVTDPWPLPNPPADVSGQGFPYVGQAADLFHFYTTFPNNFWSIGPRDPDSFSRNANLLVPGTANQWYGGKFPNPVGNSDPANSTAFRTDRVFGLDRGLATPGRANLFEAPLDADFRINEVNLDPRDNRFEYIEIANVGSSPGSRSLSNWWLVVVDSNVSASDTVGNNMVGKVLEEWNLSGMATGTNGLLLIADEAGSSHTPFQDYVPAETGKGDPVASDTEPKSTGFGAGDIGSNSGFTLLLIKNYKVSSADAMLAPDRDVDNDDNGLLNATPWGAGIVADSVGFDQVPVHVSGAGKTYATTTNLRTVFPVFTSGDANKACDNLSRKIVGGVPVTTNTPGDWYGGEYSSGAGFNLGFQPPVADEIVPGTNPKGYTHFGGFRGAATPGRVNLAAAIDPANPPIPAQIRINEVMFDPTDITFDPGNPNDHDQDDNRDYVELASDNRSLAYLDGYWLVVVDNSGNSKGLIQTGAPLDGQTTGLNGLMLLGDNYDTIAVPPYRSVEGVLPPATVTLDPAVAFGGNDIPGKGATILLIRGPAYVDSQATPNGPFKVGGPITVASNLKPTGDIDPDNDGVLLPPGDWLAPGSVLVDAVSIGSINPGPQYGYLSPSGGAWIPDCAARLPGKFGANTPGDWYFGEVEQTFSETPSTQFTTYYPTAAPAFRGHASPGRWNHSAAVGDETPGAVLLNEVHFNPAGGDSNFEFIELLDKIGAERSLNRYTLVMIDNVKSNTGTIQRAWPLDGAKTGSNGLCFVTNGPRETIPAVPPSPAVPASPWAPFVRPQTAMFDPPGRNDLITGFGDATIGAESDNQSVTLLLVRDFITYVGADFDQTIGASPAGAPSGGDGIFEVPNAAWENGRVHDSVILRSWIPDDPATLGYDPDWTGFVYKNFDGSNLADLSGTFFPKPDLVTNPNDGLFYHPETVSRFRNNLTANSSAAWYGGDLTGGLSGKSGIDTAYVSADPIAGDPTHQPVPVGFRGRTTPGQVNLARDEFADPDGDGVITLLEEAFGTDPFAYDSTNRLPTVGTKEVGGQNYATLTYYRIKGGTTDPNKVYSAEAFTYTVQTSTDLQTWNSNGATIVEVPPVSTNLDGITETVTFRLNTPLTGSGSVPKSYLRLRVGRQ